ncbi:MAG: enoyl-CoA hydratase-related protein [Gemmataceae bacterium]
MEAARSIQLTSRPDGIAVLTFDQPGSKANVLSPAMWTDFLAVLQEAAAMAPLHGLILRSAKPGIFIAGADLNVIGSAKSTHDPAVKALIDQGLRVLETLERFPAPTVAAIDGAALGGGLEVALACDFRAVGSHPKCNLGLPETMLGLIPGWGGTQRLPRIVGLEQAAEMLTTAQPIPAARAVDIGLVDASFDSGRLEDSAANLLLSRDSSARRQQKAAAIPEQIRNRFKASITVRPTAARMALLAMEKGADKPLGEAIACETAAFMQLAGSEESRQLIEAFFNRKKA